MGATESTAPDATSEESPSDAGGERTEARVGLWYTLSRLRNDATAMAGLVIVAFMALVATITTIDAVIFEYLARYQFFASMGVEKYMLAEMFWTNPTTAPPGARTLRPPVYLTNDLYPNTPGTWAHPLGTDHRGRDILVRLFYGTRIAITVGLVSTGIGMVFGTVVGAVAGYYGGWVDDVLMRSSEVLFAIPFLVLVIAFMTAFGRTLWYAMVGVGIASIPTFARLIRSRVVSVREEDYVEAAQAAGVRDYNVIGHHVIPNSFAPVIVQASLQIGTSILVVAGLSFLGYGAQPPTPSWGRMLSNARGYMLPDLWFSIWPGLAILVTVIGFNLIGDGLRDVLDPRLED